MGNEKYRGKDLQCPKHFRSLASTDLCKAAGKEGYVARRQFSNKRVETNEQKVMKLDLEDVMGEISIDDITKNTPKAARAVDFESSGGGNKLAKKTKERLESEKKFWWKAGEELKEAKRNLAKQRRKYRARKIIQKMQKVNNRHAGCHALFFCVKKRTLSDRQKWKEELERYSREKYQDEEMRTKAKKELDQWEERVRRQKDQDGEHQEPRLTMSVVMQSRASFSNGKAVGVDGISAEWHGWQDWHSSYFCQ